MKSKITREITEDPLNPMGYGLIDMMIESFDGKPDIPPQNKFKFKKRKKK